MNSVTIKQCAALVCGIFLGACTSAPPRHNSDSMPLFTQAGSGQTSSVAISGQSGRAKAQAVASAAIGVPQVFVDQQLGTSVELLVQSEYFSANGRKCRRYTQTGNETSTNGVSCQDAVNGWVDIPLSAFVR